ncbi:MAG TPA: glutamate-1-semialdehyde 2,1-aminomutase [Candidatus Dormibacteraeota bacterium]|nr:glutamate-1-semialdehyde 2,1-aminomutase [Candidatus Dormibacteraeota bacterium]
MSVGPRSREVMRRARSLMPGGVSSPVRAFAAVGGEPPVFRSASGATLVDEDGRTYIDYVLAYGPHILGHGHPAVREAIAAQLELGTAFGGPTALEAELAARIAAAIASVEMVRFVNSGTEATMSALRLARAVTGRDRIVKCAGGYHGHSDLLLVDAGSGVATLGIPGSPGVPAATVADTIVVPYNDVAAMAEAFAREGERIAAVIVEPVAGNMGCVPPRPGYLESLRELTGAHGALLVFDEVMTGFRVAPGGAQELYGVFPDLTCLGKVIGGGLPIGAYGGSEALMSQVAPSGRVYQAGTLSGNPLAMAAGCAVLDILAGGAVHAQLEQLGARLGAGLCASAEAAGVVCAVNRVGSMLTPFLGVSEVFDYTQARKADATLFAHLHAAWLEAGIFWPPSQFETGFLSSAHSESEIDRTVEEFGAALATDPLAASTS